MATVVETLCYTVIIGYNWNNAYPVSSYGVLSSLTSTIVTVAEAQAGSSLI